MPPPDYLHELRSVTIPELVKIRGKVPNLQVISHAADVVTNFSHSSFLKKFRDEYEEVLLVAIDNGSPQVPVLGRLEEDLSQLSPDDLLVVQSCNACAEAIRERCETAAGLTAVIPQARQNIRREILEIDKAAAKNARVWLGSLFNAHIHNQQYSPKEYLAFHIRLEEQYGLLHEELWHVESRLPFGEDEI